MPVRAFDAWQRGFDPAPQADHAIQETVDSENSKVSRLKLNVGIGERAIALHRGLEKELRLRHRKDVDLFKSPRYAPRTIDYALKASFVA
jgi:hypothetical protein